MKLTDNMIRVIHHAYTNNTKAEFLVKSNILQLRDNEIIIKTIEVAAMISELVKYIDTDAEKRFYAYLSSVEGYNKELIRERSIDKNLVTLKEFIIGNGLVYSEFLDYVYDSLAKYEFTSKSKDVLTMSLNKTHTQLRNILNLKNGAINITNLADMQSKLDRVNSYIASIEQDVLNKSSKVDAMNESIGSIIERLEKLDKTVNATPFLIEYTIDTNPTKSLESMTNNIKDNIEARLEEQANTIIKAIMQQIDSTDTQFIERKSVQGIEDCIRNILNNVSLNVKSRVELLTQHDIDRKAVDDIEAKVRSILNKAKSLESDTSLSDVSEMLNAIIERLDNVKIDNKSYKDLVDYNSDYISRRLK